MNDLRDTVVTILLVALLTLPWAYGVMSARTFHPIEGITAINLPAKCQLQYYYPPVETVNTLVLTCPGTEMMRLWPLPVQQPWFERGHERRENPFAEPIPANGFMYNCG